MRNKITRRETAARRKSVTAATPEAALWADMSPDSMRRLLLAALDSFANRGYHGTTTRDIASRAKMSSAAIYMHYSSKEELLFEIIRTVHQAMLAEMRRSFSIPATPIERLRNMVRVHASFHATMNTASKVANYELRPLEEEHRQEIMALRRGMEDLMREALRLGVESGDSDVEHLDVTNFMILSLGIDLSRWFSLRGALTPEQIGDLYAANILRMVEPRRSGRTRTPGSAADADVG